jgi:hypothetical protein
MKYACGEIVPEHVAWYFTTRSVVYFNRISIEEFPKSFPAHSTFHLP